MEFSIRMLLLFTVLSSVLQVVEAAGYALIGGIVGGLIGLSVLCYVLRYCVFEKHCNNQHVEPAGGEDKVVVRKVKLAQNEPQQWQVGQQAYPGKQQPNYQQPNYQQHYPAPPMHSDPAYPPPMQNGQGGPPGSNPFTNASYGQ